MAKSCRDCSRCTESATWGCLALPFRILFWPFTNFMRSMQRRCPQCGHPLKWHAQDASGRFKD